MVMVVAMIYSDGVDGCGCGRCGGLQFVGDFGWWWGFLWVMLRIVVRMLNSWRGSFHSHRNSNV